METDFSLNFHKVRSENLPKSVEPGTQHVYYVFDGVSVVQYIADVEGHLIPIKASYSPQHSLEYYNSYTQSRIDERKETIKDLYNSGHCFAFAVATDLHIREDGDAGRYDQVRDFIMLTEQLPIDFVLCLGDIMGYSAEWDGIREARANGVRKIFDRLKCPWFVTRGDYDYNDNDNGHESNDKIVPVSLDNINDLYINNNAWYRSILYNKDQKVGIDVVFDEARPQCGYFYVDDYIHKHRFIMLNSEETHESADGKPYVTKAGVIDAYVTGIQTKHQLDWLCNKAMDMTGKLDWTVSFNSHAVPYTDGGESVIGTGDEVYTPDGKREFHGYGWNDPELRQMVYAFQHGIFYAASFSCLDVDTHRWVSYNISKDFSEQGAIDVIGWFGGHIHDDCYRKVRDLDISVSTCTAAEQREIWSQDVRFEVTVSNGVVTIDGVDYEVVDGKFRYHNRDYTLVNDKATIYYGKLPPERNSTDCAMSVNIFIVNKDTKTVNMVKVGSKRDNSVLTSSDYSYSYMR